VDPMEAVPPALATNVAHVPTATGVPPPTMLPSEAQVVPGMVAATPVAAPAMMALPMAAPLTVPTAVTATQAVVPATASAVIPAAAITTSAAAVMPMAVVATVATEVGQTIVPQLAGDAGAPKRGRPSGSKVPRWTPEEDEVLKQLVAEKGERAWKEVAACLEHSRSATAVEQHYNILVGKRKKPGSKEDGEDEALDDELKAERTRLLNERQAKKQGDKDERAAAKRAEKEAKVAEKEAKAAEKEAEKVAAKEKREREAAERQAKKDMPKKPRTSYILFCEKVRAELKAKYPENSVIELAKIQGEMWKALSQEEKDEYKAMGDEDMLRYKREMEAGGHSLEKPKAPKEAKSPKEPPKKKKKKGTTEWWLPDGYVVQEEPPALEQVEFGNEAGDALVGRKIMFNWDGIGWCEGLIEARNDEKRFRIDGDFVNFWVHYPIDDNLSRHNLELNDYAFGPEADLDSWVLLTQTDDGPSKKGDDAGDGEDGDEEGDAAATDDGSEAAPDDEGDTAAAMEEEA